MSTLDIQIKRSGSNYKVFRSDKCYSRSSFLKKTLICHDCYSLFRDPEVFNACRKNCFYNNAFQVHFSFITIFCLFFIFTIKRSFSLCYNAVFQVHFPFSFITMSYYRFIFTLLQFRIPGSFSLYYSFVFQVHFPFITMSYSRFIFPFIIMSYSRFIFPLLQFRIPG